MSSPGPSGPTEGSAVPSSAAALTPRAAGVEQFSFALLHPQRAFGVAHPRRLLLEPGGADAFLQAALPVFEQEQLFVGRAIVVRYVLSDNLLNEIVLGWQKPLEAKQRYFVCFTLVRGYALPPCLVLSLQGNILTPSCFFLQNLSQHNPSHQLSTSVSRTHRQQALRTPRSAILNP